MATNTNTTHTPGTVKGTARVTTTQLVPGMIIRFPGNKRAGRAARTAMIIAVRSELRSNGNYSKRARWYLVDFADGTGATFAPASRHDVTADSTGAPIVEPASHVAGIIAGRDAAQHSDQTAGFRAQVERYGRRLDEHDLGHLVDACRENVTDELGPEPTEPGTVESARWWSRLAASIWSEADGNYGIDLDQEPTPEQPRTIAATEPAGPVLTLVLKDHTTQGSLF